MKTKMYYISLYLLGLLIMGLGISLYITANIGVGSWDALHLNLSEFIGLTPGWWVFLVGVIVIIISQIMDRNFFNLLSILTGLLFGRIIDLWLYIWQNTLPFNLTIYHQYSLFFIGLLFLGSGIALLVLSKLPPTPPDVLMMSISRRFKINYFWSKTISELFVFFLAILVGAINNRALNNIGIGTVLSLLMIGTIVHNTTHFFKRVLMIR